VRWALPHVLVEDGAERVALYAGPGFRGARPARFVDDYIEQLATGAWDFEEHVWHTHHVLRLTPLARAHSMDLYWDEAWAFRGWYVNLQAPLVRSRFGFDTADHALDVVVRPNRSWRWKDEDHLAALVERGVYTPTEAAAIRAEGKSVIDRFDELLPTGCEEWRPDPDWPEPTLPEDWGRL
jgi:uncharacterized protein